MQARFYHPGFGRFTAPDPARDQHFDNTQSWNIYSYVRNNPIMSVDPTGMVEKEPPPPPGSNQPRSISESMDAGGSNPGFGAQTDSKSALTAEDKGAAAGFTMPSGLSAKGEAFLKKQEGYNGSLYDDSEGHATIGWGHKVSDNSITTKGDAEIDKYKKGITTETAQGLFNADVKWVVDGIRKNVNANLSTQQFDALVSVGFNAGRNALVRSPMVKSMEGGDFAAAGTAIKTFKSSGLETRRLAEYNLFASGVY